MSFTSWLRNCKRALAGRMGKLSRQCVSFRPRLEGLEDRLTPSTTILQTNLVSDNIQVTPAQVQDPNLVNPWGLAASPAGAWWIANEGTATSTLYNTSTAQTSVVPLVENVPGAPTGTVFNTSGTGFNVTANAHTGSSVFLFASATGNISGWNPNVDATNAVVAASKPGAIYLGLAMASSPQGSPRLYASDFAHNTIDVYDQNFNLVTNLPGNFADSQMPANYHAFNVQAIDNKLYVEYTPIASVLAGTAAAGEGAVDVYNANGQLQKRLVLPGNTHINQPWAVAMAPANFGKFSNDLLVGNFGNGHINAFNPQNGHFVGELKDANGQPIAITHLWGLAFGNGGAAGPSNTLYFTAGLTSNLQGIPPFHGLFGSLQAVGGSQQDNSDDDNDNQQGPQILSPVLSTSTMPSSSILLSTMSAPPGLPYPTAATVDQLMADINYADNTGGAFTLNLQPGTTFNLSNELAIGAGVELTILGNGDTIDGAGHRLFNVASGASLTLDHLTLQGGYVWWEDGGGIYNAGGNLTLSNSILSGNTAHAGAGGGIFNAGGTVTVNNSTLTGNMSEGGNGGAIYNAGGWVTLNNSAISGNSATVIDYIGGSHGAGIHNSNGTVTVQNSSCITGNSSEWYGEVFNFDVDNYYGAVYQDSTSAIGALYGNPAVLLDPNAPQLQISDVNVAEGNAGTVAAQFIVTLSAASTETISVAYATADGTATAGSDYQAASGTLTFAAGETSKTIAVLVNGDRLGEPNETFTVKLSAATNATIPVSRAVGTIVDDEPHVTITDVSKQEGKKGQTTNFTFTVTLSTAYDQAVTMSYRTADGTARSGDDYVAKTGTLTFAPGETTKTITIAVKGDSKRETDETFFVDLLGLCSNALSTKSRGIGTILNDD